MQVETWLKIQNGRTSGPEILKISGNVVFQDFWRI
jgi:hypothetical protein